MNDPELAPLLDVCRKLDEVLAVPLPAARLMTPLDPVPARVAVLPGAFNPPTLAHLALARAARQRGFPVVLFSLGRVTIDKDERGLMLEDRVRLLVELTRKEAGLGVILQNRGLYADQAEAVHRTLPGVTDLAFVIGMDKLPQIFDPAYYEEIGPALRRLFDRARLLVASRGEQGRRALRAILAQPFGRPFAGHVEWLAVGRRWRDASATQVRERLGSGGSALDLLPAEVEEFVRATGAFGGETNRRYLDRVAALRRVAADLKP
jgi:nicotinic acid mononucleotide adenylyltransferase